MERTHLGPNRETKFHFPFYFHFGLDAKKTGLFLFLRLEVLKRVESNRPFSGGKKIGQNEEFTLEKYFLANCLAIFLRCFQRSSTKRYRGQHYLNAGEFLLQRVLLCQPCRGLCEKIELKEGIEI